MIAKGNTHSDGVKLAEYMEQGKEGERAELWQLRGFEATNIKDAFRDVDIMAGATKCEQPFFHVQVRNREGETLTRQQWEYTADRIERMLGLTGQPRAITFHTYERNDHEHMHIAWSRIDQDTLTAKPLPFFKQRLKKISRELEIEFGLTPVQNEREGPIKYAPTKAQDEQARRVGVDVHDIRNAIRNCWDRSDNGHSFQAALEDEGLMLAQGDRRGFVVIDQGGGIHALSKRILDVTASKIRDRLSDLTLTELPTVEQARSYVPGYRQDLKQELADVGKLIDQVLENGAKPQPEKPAPVWDRDRAERVWQDAVINAAIEKEKVERQFVEPKERHPQTKNGQAGAGSRKKEWPIMPPTPEPISTSPAYHFEDAAREATRNETYTPPKELRGMSDQIMTFLKTLWNDPDRLDSLGTQARTLSGYLDERGIDFAQLTKQDADRSHRQAEFAKAVGHFAPRFNEGEIVAITERRAEYRRNGEIIEPGRVLKLDQSAAREFVAFLDKGTQLLGIEATLHRSDERAQQRSADRETKRLDWATKYRDGSRQSANENVKAPAAAVGRTTVRTIGKVFDVVASAFESLLSPTLSPEQIQDGQKAMNRREAEAEQTIDFSSYTAELAQQRQHQEQDREAARQRERDGRER